MGIGNIIDLYLKVQIYQGKKQTRNQNKTQTKPKQNEFSEEYCKNISLPFPPSHTFYIVSLINLQPKQTIMIFSKGGKSSHMKTPLISLKGAQFFGMLYCEKYSFAIDSFFTFFKLR